MSLKNWIYFDDGPTMLGAHARPGLGGLLISYIIFR